MSGLTAVNMVSGLTSTVAFNFIYSKSVGVDRGLIFFIAGIMFVPCLPLVW